MDSGGRLGVGGSLSGSLAGGLAANGGASSHASGGKSNVERLVVSRQSCAPHHHARVAAAAARTANNASNLAAESTASLGSSPALGSQTLANNNSKENSSPSQWTALDLGGMLMRNLAPAAFDYSFLTTLYLNHNNFTYIPHEIARLKCLVYLDLSGNKLVQLPPEMGLLVSLKELLLFDNQLTYVPMELGNLYQLETFGLEGNPLSEPYMGILQKDGALSIISYLRENLPAGPQPAEREWITMDESFTQSDPNAFTVLCYNTLCDKYATPQAYPYTPSWALAWDYRKELILEELLNYNADILCLQEMETSQFEEYFQEYLLSNTEYEGVFWPKSRSRTMGEYERRQVDGCATFFKSSKFSLVEKHTLEFQQIAMQRPELRRTEDVFNRVMVKDNIGLILVLQSKESPFKLIVVNTHLHWDAAAADVKLVQTAMLLEELAKVVAAHTPTLPPGANRAPPSLPIVFCGDFNSLPESGVHALLSTGSVPRDHPDFMTYTYGAYTREGIRHPFELRSAYPPNVLEFTNFTPLFRGVIDWIWVSSPTLDVGGVLGGVDTEHVKGCVGFPNAHHPSDHVPLMASLCWKGSGKDEKGTKKK
ncbi:Endonuclease/exonuclease/phosphatase [Chytriomyces sp. MP71]|nr:Endonuclease/exonuclease/phosphatase [Chytriomyces sp. MP71]